MTELERLRIALGNRYALERPIGSGGMATVYLAGDARHDRRVAIKVLKVELAAAIGKDRFLREIKIAANLAHPHILPLFDSGEAAEFLYYVMPYIDGPSLRERLRREGQLPIEEAVTIAKRVAQGLDSAHRRGVVHRDIKPDNILFNDGQPLVADFGVALVIDAAKGDRLTEPGLPIGTPAYMSPEQASGDSRLDERSDVYSLGCVLYEMLVGQPPFVGHNIQAIMARHVTDPVPPLTTVRPSVSDGLERAIMRSLAKVPMDRYETALAFAEALDAPEALRVVSDVKSIAVIPFVNLSRDPQAEIFSDGLTEEIVAGLARVRTFRVISRTSVMQLKGTTKSLRLIGRELNVRYVLEGSVRVVGQHVRMTSQLVDASSDTQVWANRYTEDTHKMLEVQDRLAGAIVDELRAQLAPGEGPAPASRPMRNVHAEECYLRARRETWTFTEPAAIRALQALQEALEIVGEDVLLYAGIAEAYYIFPQIRGNEPAACLERVKECADRIADLDPNGGYGPWLAGLLEWRQPGGARDGFTHLRAALDADATDPSILFWSGLYANELGHEPTVEFCVDRLLHVDPRGPRTQWLVGWYHLLSGRLDAATEAFRANYEVHRDNAQARFYYMYALACDNHESEAIALSDVMLRDPPDSVGTWIGKFYRHALQGYKKRALKTITPALRQAARWSETYSLHMAEGLALIDETTQALEWLENAIRRGFVNFPYLAERARLLDGVRNEDRFDRLLDSARAEWNQWRR